KKYRLRREIRHLTTKLREETNSGNQQAMQATLKKLQESRDQLDRSDDAMFSEVKNMLNSQQLAQFVLIMDEIRHEVRAVRRRGRRAYPGGGYVPSGAPQPQRGYTNQPTHPGYWRGYAPAQPSGNGSL
ncbi:MAG: hypothetical protein R3257_08085, partial [bacterium]|nr:hypothetical protein [bacterium]